MNAWKDVRGVGEDLDRLGRPQVSWSCLSMVSHVVRLPLQEIINACRIINTPIIDVHLEDEMSLVTARRVKGRIEKTLLGQVHHLC